MTGSLVHSFRIMRQRTALGFCIAVGILCSVGERAGAEGTGEASLHREMTEPSERTSGDETAEPTDPDAKGFLGVGMGDELPNQPGAVVTSIDPGSAADNAGIVLNDVIVRVDDVSIGDADALRAKVSSIKPGTHVKISLIRAQKLLVLDAVLGAKPLSRDQQLRRTFVGHAAPELRRLRLVRGPLKPSLRGQRGQVVVIEFWEPGCGPCEGMVPELNRLQASYRKAGLRVLSITTAPSLEAGVEARRQGMKYSVLSDESEETHDAYQVGASPTIYFVDRKGVIRDMRVGSCEFETLEQMTAPLLVEPKEQIGSAK